MEELANLDQLRFLLNLHAQLGMAVDPRELARLTKWQAAERINLLRGRPAMSAETLDMALHHIVELRVEQFGDDLPTDAIREQQEPDGPATRQP